MCKGNITRGCGQRVRTANVYCGKCLVMNDFLLFPSCFLLILRSSFSSPPLVLILSLNSFYIESSDSIKAEGATDGDLDFTNSACPDLIDFDYSEDVDNNLSDEEA